MALITLWHNPRCSKSRAALKLLEDAGAEIDLRLYLKDPPSAPELKEMAKALGLAPSEFVRRGEAVFKENNLGDASDTDLIAAMAEHPILIERPIARLGDRAVVGRPPEAVLSLLS